MINVTFALHTTLHLEDENNEDEIIYLKYCCKITNEFDLLVAPVLISISVLQF